MKKQLASLTSNILNPYLVGLIIILLISFESTATTGEAVKWSLILTGISILPVFFVVVYLTRKDKLADIFITVRRQRNKIYALSGVCAGIGIGILLYFEAPTVLMATLVAALSVTVVFMGINLMWKISLHTALAAGSVTVLTILYGSTGAISAMLLPPIAWSRIELECHSIAQTVAGAFLAALIVAAVFYFFGLIGFAGPL